MAPGPVGRLLQAVAIGVVVVVGLAQTALPLRALKVGVATSLSDWVSTSLCATAIPAGAGMQVGFGDLTQWSFLMASAHGAGLMVLPILFGISSGESLSGSGRFDVSYACELCRWSNNKPAGDSGAHSGIPGGDRPFAGLTSEC